MDFCFSILKFNQYLFPEKIEKTKVFNVSKFIFYFYPRNIFFNSINDDILRHKVAEQKYAS